MLTELLNLIALGKAWSIDDLSKELGVSKEQVLAGINFLEQSNYIKRVDFRCCTGQCGNCHACEGMELLSAQPLMWELVKQSKNLPV